MKQVNEKILCAGHGGQGIMLMGKLLAFTGMNMGYNVSWIPSYGAEVRGGTAHSMVQINQGSKIANPLVTRPTSCIVMNEASLGRFIDSVPDGGLLIVNSSAVREIPERKKIVIRSAAFDKIAVSIGDKRSANMAALGFLSALKGLFPLKELEQSVSSVFPKGEIRDKNIKALREGFGLLNVNGGI